MIKRSKLMRLTTRDKYHQVSVQQKMSPFKEKSMKCYQLINQLYLRSGFQPTSTTMPLATTFRN